MRGRRSSSISFSSPLATLALLYADRGYVLENGRVVLEGAARELAQRPDITHFYLGVGSQQRHGSFDSRDSPTPPDA